MPNEPKPDHQLRVLMDPAGQKIATKLFDEYIKRDDKGDYARLPEWMLAIDRLLLEFGGKPVPPDEDDGEPDRRGGGDNSGSDDAGYEPDEDIHQEQSFARIKQAVTAALRKSK